MRYRAPGHAGYIALRLPHGVKQIFSDWLEAHYPLRKERVLNRLRSMRGGGLYDSYYSQRMTGTGTHATMLKKTFETFCRRHGLKTGGVDLSTGHFRKPDKQRSLF